MTDYCGAMRLYDPSANKQIAYFDFGTVTGISETFQKSCSITPIVTLSKQSAFPLETRTYKQISVSFTRKQPAAIKDNGTDPTKWSNGLWQERIMKSLDRWQARTNGYRLTYTPTDDNPYVSPIDVNGYVKSLTIKAVQGRPESIQGTLEFHVGSMRIVTRTDEGADKGSSCADFSVTLSDSRRKKEYPLLSSSMNLNLIDSLTVTGGPEAPFQYAQLTIPRKKLSSTYPALLTTLQTYVNDIKAGRNRLTINTVGTTIMTLSKVKLSRDTLTLTAYCDAERIKGRTLDSAGAFTPAAWLAHILKANNYGLSFTDMGDDPSYIHNFDDPTDEPDETDERSGRTRHKQWTITFDEGTNVWYILQVCAMLCGAKIFFADNKAYVIDYRKLSGDGIDLYGTGDCSQSVVGTVDLGDEGTDTVVNTIRVTCTMPLVENGAYKTGDDSTKTAEYPVVGDSVGIYGECDGGQYRMLPLKQNDPSTLSELFPDKTPTEGAGATAGSGGTGDATGTDAVDVYIQAERFASNLMDYISEAQQTVEFTMREATGTGEGSWAPFFGPVAVASFIADDADEIYVDDASEVTGGSKPQKLALKTFTRSYPECTTEYTWGVLASMDLASNTSKIASAQNNRGRSRGGGTAPRLLFLLQSSHTFLRSMRTTATYARTTSTSAARSTHWYSNPFCSGSAVPESA